MTSATRRVVTGDGRAPVLTAGDAAQTGHVFTGLNCFVNLLLASKLATGLCRAGDAIAAGRLRAPALIDAFEAYERASEHGVRVLSQASWPHFARHNGSSGARPP
jgi:chitinase